MGKIAVEQAGQGLAVVNRLLPAEGFSQREYGIVAGGALPGLLPVAYEDKKKKRALVCTAAEMIPLRAYFSGIVTRQVFTDILSQLVSIVRSCETNGLDLRNLSLSLDHIFVRPSTKELRCILWPLVNNQNPCDAGAFFRDIPYGLVFSKQEDCTYVADYIQFFRTRAEPFSVQALEQFLGGGPAGAAPPFDPLRQMVEQKAGAAGRNVCPNCGVVNAVDGKICVSCGAALVEQGGTLAPAKSGTGVLGYSPGFGDVDSGESPYPYLIRESTNQVISVDKPHFRIGKDKDTADFCVSDNAAISRSHAVIHIRDDRYFIVDQNSTNKTYLDGRAIPPNQEVEIFPGARIELGNEKFTFYI